MGEALHNLGIEGTALIAQIVNFGILLFVLWKFLYTPILKVLDERSAKIAQSQKDAEKIEKALAKSEKEQEAIILTAKQEADQIIKAAKKTAKEVEKDIITKADEKAKGIVAEAELKAAKVKGEMLDTLKGDISLLVEESVMTILKKDGGKFDDALITEALEKV